MIITTHGSATTHKTVYLCMWAHAGMCIHTHARIHTRIHIYSFLFLKLYFLEFTVHDLITKGAAKTLGVCTCLQHIPGEIPHPVHLL